MSTPAGVPAISRGLSEAIPPENVVTEPHPEGVPECVSLEIDTKHWSTASATPPGSSSIYGRRNRGCRSAQPPANNCDPSGVEAMLSIPSFVSLLISVSAVFLALTNAASAQNSLPDAPPPADLLRSNPSGSVPTGPLLDAAPG